MEEIEPKAQNTAIYKPLLTLSDWQGKMRTIFTVKTVKRSFFVVQTAMDACVQ
jgi:hypothetical protein